MIELNTSAAQEERGQHYGMLFVFIGLCFSAAGTGVFFPPDEWYATLTRPEFAPPNWVFGPVWTILYLMIAVSGWLVWKSAAFNVTRPALTVFAVQLVLNSAWTAIFFGWHRPGLALIEMCVLWLSIVATIMLFRRHSKIAANLLTPYLAWVSFAMLLNYGFWRLN
jgi:benzodiazapine receptor